MQKNYIKETISGIIIVIAFLIGLIIVYKTTDIFKKPETKVPEIEESVITEEEIEKQKEEKKQKEEAKKQLSDFQKYQSYNHLSIYPNGIATPLDYIKNPEKVLIRVAETIIVSGKIEDVYIYIKAGVGKPLQELTEYDTLYLYLMNGQYQGGHLDLKQSKLSEFSEVETTEVLYNLKNMPLAGSLENYQEGKINSLNLLDNLNAREKHYIAGLVSTASYGEIIEMILAYQCAENSKCEIRLLTQ